MDIQIKKNDYVRPKDIRKGVVKKVCEIVVKYLDNNDDYEIEIGDPHPHFYLGEGIKDSTKMRISGYKNNPSYYNYIQINSCEMSTVFMVLQQNGYYIFICGDHKYVISKYPYRFNKQANKDVRFTHFID